MLSIATPWYMGMYNKEFVGVSARFGLLVADRIQWLSASVDAQVERVVVEPGKLVKKGEITIELSNTQLQQLL
jgi:hypothetical protein